MILRNTILIAAIVFIIGCAATPQAPVSLSDNILKPSDNIKVGIVMTEIPPLDVHIYGAGCLLCIAAAEIANSSLSEHTNTLSHDNLPDIKQTLAKLLQDNGVETLVIDSTFSASMLPKYKAPSGAVNVAPRDLSVYANQYGLTHVIVIEVGALGFKRTYANYVPTSDPQGYFLGTSYLVNLSDNTYQWYVPLEILKSVNDTWNEPPTFPALTNAYYQALETGRDMILTPFSNINNDNASL